MNISRLVVYSVVLFLIYKVLVWGLGSLNFFAEKDGMFQVLVALVLVFVGLLAAKWYFHSVKPTTKSGFVLGLVTILVFVVLTFAYNFFAADTILYGLTGWGFYVSLVAVFLVSLYAGFEFDATYTKEVQKEA